MWYHELIKRLRKELPRWRWTSKLGQRGGTLDGETQKQNIHLEIKYARGHWSLNASGLLGSKQPQWTLTLEKVQVSTLEGLILTIVAECV